ncbi:MAG: hypothetical protein LC776_04195, partial [Acidobacteria bacterium]|nr:hypothetical protein [Acidobacteriota bacterium]
MAKRTFQTLQLLPAALVILSAAIFTCVEAQPLRLTEPVVSRPLYFPPQQLPEPKNRKQNNRPGQSPHPAEITEDSKADAAPVTYSFEFSQPEFHVCHIVIEHDASGRGKITFERLNEEASVVEPIGLSPSVLSRLMELWQSLRFLES